MSPSSRSCLRRSENIVTRHHLPTIQVVPDGTASAGRRVVYGLLAVLGIVLIVLVQVSDLAGTIVALAFVVIGVTVCIFAAAALGLDRFARYLRYGYLIALVWVVVVLLWAFGLFRGY